ncbi:hypothetical protein D3C86_1867460 [compost metagenome]
MHTLLLRHPAPQRHCQAVPTAQAPLESGGLSGVEAHFAVVFGLNLALGQCDDSHLGRPAIKTKSRQFGIIGMGGDD